jgi:hypothetical protein
MFRYVNKHLCIHVSQRVDVPLHNNSQRVGVHFGWSRQSRVPPVDSVRVTHEQRR